MLISLALLLCLAAPAPALTPPAGWTATGPNAAALDPGEPLRGELLEFRVSGGTGDVDELLLLLRTRGLDARSVNPDGEAFGLHLGERIGRARFEPAEGGVTWVVVTAAPAHATALDPDAVLLSALSGGPPPAHMATGPAPRQPMAAGKDGATWSGGAVGATPAGWQPEAATSWAHDPRVVGVWEGSALVDFRPTRLTFRFDASGAVSVERRGGGTAETVEGTWATRDGVLRLTLPGGGDNLPYRSGAGALSFEYAGTRLDLAPAR